MLKKLFTSLRRKNLHTWVGGYTRQLATHLPALAERETGTKHLLFAFCDHYEPLWGSANESRGEARVRAWHTQYPAMASAFRDADGRPPRHSFFFPGEQYASSYLDMLGDLAQRGFGEVELHLHHDNDTAHTLRRDIASYVAALSRHGHLTRTAEGRSLFAFIHGNWALANARRDGRWCGVDEEIPLLFDAGCYADYTFPSAPDECQPNIVNQIYWPVGDLSRKRAYEKGEAARVGVRRRDRLLMIEGPLGLALRPEKLGIRIESAAVTAADPATPARIRSWASQRIHIEGRPEWVFVKVHTHGAPDDQAASLLGDGGRMLHHELTSRYNDGKHWALHYVTAREMFNIAAAAMDGKTGDPNLYRDYELTVPPVAHR